MLGAGEEKDSTIRLYRMFIFVDTWKDGCRHPLCHHPCDVTKETLGASKVTNNALWISDRAVFN